MVALPSRLIFTKAAEAETVDVDEAARTIVSVVTTDRVDSDKEIVLTEGLNWQRHEKNPVVLFMHQPDAVIAKCNWRKPKKRQVVAKTQFAETELAEEVFQLYKGGFLRGWSIGMDWNTIKRRDLTPDDVRKRKDWAGAQSVIESADVLEYSAVSVPANEDAVNRAAAEGLIKHTKAFLMPDDEHSTADNAIARGGEWVDMRNQDSIVVRIAGVKTVAPVRIKPGVVRPAGLTLVEILQIAERRMRYLRGMD